MADAQVLVHQLVHAGGAAGVGAQHGDAPAAVLHARPEVARVQGGQPVLPLREQRLPLGVRHAAGPAVPRQPRRLAQLSGEPRTHALHRGMQPGVSGLAATCSPA
jgi:hypothetical protein